MRRAHIFDVAMLRLKWTVAKKGSVNAEKEMLAAITNEIEPYLMFHFNTDFYFNTFIFFFF